MRDTPALASSIAPSAAHWIGRPIGRRRAATKHSVTETRSGVAISSM